MGWGISYYENADGDAPGEVFLLACPVKVRAHFLAVLEAVRDAPPPQFSGGGKWEAMHGAMGGYYEIRVTGPQHTHYRLFCRLDNGSKKDLKARGFGSPQILVINGLSKANATTFSDSTYKKRVRDLGDDYLSKSPRPVKK